LAAFRSSLRGVPSLLNFQQAKARKGQKGQKARKVIQARPEQKARRGQMEKMEGMEHRATPEPQGHQERQGQ
jgi:hypothetical protein